MNIACGMDNPGKCYNIKQDYVCYVAEIMVKKGNNNFNYKEDMLLCVRV